MKISKINPDQLLTAESQFLTHINRLRKNVVVSYLTGVTKIDSGFIHSFSGSCVLGTYLKKQKVGKGLPCCAAIRHDC